MMQQRDFAEKLPIGQGGDGISFFVQDFDATLANHVHLFARIAVLKYHVPGSEYLRTQAEHNFAYQAGRGALQNGHSFQDVFVQREGYYHLQGAR